MAMEDGKNGQEGWAWGYQSSERDSTWRLGSRDWEEAVLKTDNRLVTSSLEMVTGCTLKLSGQGQILMIFYSIHCPCLGKKILS